ncbi:MAG: hypothetical protein J6N20_06660 [Pseudomonas sp.]|nr:hypothetical protein [Pseudomonas sp.]
MTARALNALILSVLTLLTGCSVFRSYDSELQATNQQLSAGNVDGALVLLEQNNSSQNKDLLYYLEKGELLRAKGDLAASQKAWRNADKLIYAWEESVRLDTARYLAQFSSFLVNDKVRRYEGHDYEKVWLSTQMALNLLNLNDFEGARTEIKKTHEREALITELRDKEYLKREQEAERRGVRARLKDLRGYPLESLDAPDVLELKNSYQSAFSHYLAGFVYEALGERSLAAPGYRKAAELRPNTPLIEQNLLNLDKPEARSDESEVLIVLQNGFAPARDSIRLPLPLTISNNLVITPLSFPVIRPYTPNTPLTHVVVNGQLHPLTLLNTTTTMSRRALRDELPWILLRNSARAVTRGVAQKQLNDDNPLAGLLLGVASTVLEDADTRTWRTLADNTYVVRLRLNRGEHQISLPDIPGSTPIRIRAERGYQVITIRTIGNRVFHHAAAGSTTPVTPPLAFISRQKP